MIFNREQLLEATKLKTETVSIGKGKVLVSEISPFDYLELCKLCTSNEIKDDEIVPNKDGGISLKFNKYNPALICFCVVDEKGERIFKNEDIEFLEKKQSQVTFQPIIEAAKRLNGLTGDEGNASVPTESDLTSGE